ncbi:hypothetical protein RHODGE_RHODGE_04095 [Rhodoplanes serenus]|uniref:AMIN domain-containing protein n=2 Tax=Nitrobacteraceae TaxID=41294 RepID=A0A3S4B323_9BRAD|nr:hypothetical protein RHODGE_RHODGE_04095 [Rhodoplanes serenus]
MIGAAVAAAAASLSTGIATAAPPESRFEVSPDSRTVHIRVDGVSRREVIERLFDGRNVVLEWHDPAFAAEPVSGVFRGSLAQVARRLLGEANYVMSYTAGEAPRLSRLVVMGKTRAEPGGSAAPVVANRDERPASRASGVSAPSPHPTDPTLDRPSRVVALPAAPPQPSRLSSDLPIRLAADPRSAVLPETAAGSPVANPSPSALVPEPHPVEISIAAMMPGTPVESIEPPMPGPIAEGIVLPAPALASE